MNHCYPLTFDNRAELTLGLGQIWGEERQAAAEETGQAIAAGDAIAGLIKAVRPFLNAGTWSGPAADSWMGDWDNFYGRLLRMLQELPAAQATVQASVAKEITAQQQRETSA